MTDTNKADVEPHQGCACRWDADDNRVATCVRHQGWIDVVQEWADRARDAEANARELTKMLDDANKVIVLYAEQLKTYREREKTMGWNQS